MGHQEALLEKISKMVVTYQEEEIGALCREAIDTGIDPLRIILGGLGRGMTEVGELFEKKEYFVPEVLMCADTMNIGLDLVKPHLPKNASQNKGTIVLGTVQGDVHTIGKDLIKLMSSINGYTVIDLGADVPLEKFSAEQQKSNADIVAMSAMMTTTMMGMKQAIQRVRENDATCGIIIGGAPVTAQVAKLFGADGFAESSGSVVAELDRMMEDIRETKAIA